MPCHSRYGTARQSAHCFSEVQELLGQTSHYSERVRKDALAGMADLLARHPEELRRQVGIGTFIEGPPAHQVR